MGVRELGVTDLLFRVTTGVDKMMAKNLASALAGLISCLGHVGYSILCSKVGG